MGGGGGEKRKGVRSGPEPLGETWKEEKATRVGPHPGDEETQAQTEWPSLGPYAGAQVLLPDGETAGTDIKAGDA